MEGPEKKKKKKKGYWTLGMWGKTCRLPYPYAQTALRRSTPLGQIVDKLLYVYQDVDDCKRGHAACSSRRATALSRHGTLTCLCLLRTESCPFYRTHWCIHMIEFHANVALQAYSRGALDGW